MEVDNKMNEKIYKCVCGKEFTNKQAYCGHCGRCKIAHPDIDYFYLRGRTWHQKGWSKGLTKYTDERVRRISENRKGKSHPQSEETKKKISESCKVNGGGYRKGSGRGKKGWYKGIFCDSSYELAFLIYCLEHNIPIKRCTNRYKYFYNDKYHYYIPDFIINNNEIVEIKGFMREVDYVKIKSVNEGVTLICGSDNKYIDYVINKYGYSYTDLYE